MPLANSVLTDYRVPIHSERDRALNNFFKPLEYQAEIEARLSEGDFEVFRLAAHRRDNQTVVTLLFQARCLVNLTAYRGMCLSLMCTHPITQEAITLMDTVEREFKRDTPNAAQGQECEVVNFSHTFFAQPAPYEQLISDQNFDFCVSLAQDTNPTVSES